jgi:hypothetical protein
MSDMAQIDQFTSFCGLYCRDCIPSNESLYRNVNQLMEKLSELEFENYADYKIPEEKQFSKYKDFISVLEKISQLHCKSYCRSPEFSKPCNIRKCVIKKDLEGCWDCEEVNCKLLQKFKEIHPNLDYHHQLIRSKGNEWVQHRKSHYKWQND